MPIKKLTTQEVVEHIILFNKKKKNKKKYTFEHISPSKVNIPLPNTVNYTEIIMNYLANNF